MIQTLHVNRRPNRGSAQWRVIGSGGSRRKLVVIYDHPVDDDPGTARIVSVWTR